MRAVLDTNIFVSALVLPGGHADKALLAAADGRFQLVTSRPIIHEVLGVLARKFARDREQLARTALFLVELGDVVRPRHRVQVLRDEPDNRILECAAAGRARYIVTGDRAMLDLREHAGTQIVTLRQLLDLLETGS